MKYDQFGQPYTTTEELCNLIYENPDLDISNFMVEDWDKYNTSVKLTYSDLPLVKEYHVLPSDYSVDLFHIMNQESWNMPDEYKNMDIAKWALDKCVTQDQLQRVGKELLMFQERNLFDLLKYLKYFVDTMRSNNVLWGLGRGSSVASYVLYLIGVHKIDSMYYDLSITEFLK